MTLEKQQLNPENIRLSESKQVLLEKYLKKQPARKPEAKAAIPVSPSGEPIPLSFAQQQVWLHSQMAGDIPIYNEAITIYRLGPLDAKVFERCMVEILRRHEIWRTTFDTAGGFPIQIVQSAPHKFPLEMTDVRHLEESERDREARRSEERRVGKECRSRRSTDH